MNARQEAQQAANAAEAEAARLDVLPVGDPQVQVTLQAYQQHQREYEAAMHKMWSLQSTTANSNLSGESPTPGMTDCLQSGKRTTQIACVRLPGGAITTEASHMPTS